MVCINVVSFDAENRRMSILWTKRNVQERTKNWKEATALLVKKKKV